jgi:hypothetical protein
MPPTNERVAAMVRAAIAKDPRVENAELRRRAAEIDRAVRRLSPRQFHATYRLPALRSAAANGAQKRATKTAPQLPASTPAPRSAPSAPATPAAAPPPPPPPKSEPAAQTSAAAASTPAVSPAPASTASSRALARPHAAEREAVRAMLQTVAREALATEDRVGFVRLLDSLDERATVILGLFGRG